MTKYITIKFTKLQVENFLKYFGGFAEDWLAEKPKGQELRDVRVMERFLKKLKVSVESESKT